MSIHWRPELNPLTKPTSFTARYVPQMISGYDELARRLAQRLPSVGQEIIKAVLLALPEAIIAELVAGNQITLEGLFACHPSVTTRMTDPGDPLPPNEECLHVRFYPSKRLVRLFRARARLERLPPKEKMPFILEARDTVLHLANVLNPNGILQLIGSNLLFHQDQEGCGCVISGTRDGSMVQDRYGVVAKGEIILAPKVPAQSAPWNNEYRLSVTTRYTEHGYLRTITYGNRLRTPLALTLGQGGGLLSSNEASPLVTLGNGSLSGGSVLVRIQARFHGQDKNLSLGLLPMNEKDRPGQVVSVLGNGLYTLPGMVGSPLSEVQVTVQDYDALRQLVIERYHGRLVDIVEITAAP